MLLTPFVADADDEKTQAFVSKYKELYGDTPNQFGADAYDAIYSDQKLQSRKAGVTPDMSASDNRISSDRGYDKDFCRWSEQVMA